MKFPQKPIQYQKGYCEFYKLKFKLTQDVLIPRPETELLVDAVLKFVNRESDIVNRDSSNTINHKPLTIIDIGTGSGCISISILKNLKSAKIIATDISEKALEVAKMNANFHKVEKRIIFLKSDLLSFVKSDVISSENEKSEDSNLEISHSVRDDNEKVQTNKKPKSPDVIVTNLPYIPTGRLLFIDPMVTEFEPRIALDGGNGGFEIYSRLLREMKEKNFIPKLFLGEIDYEQGQIARSVVNQIFPDAKVEILKDLTGNDRILKINF